MVDSTPSSRGTTYLLIGAASALGAYRILSHVVEQSTSDVASLRALQTNNVGRSKRSAWYQMWGSGTSSRALSSDSLALLALSPSYKLRTAATDVLLDRAINDPKVLACILDACARGGDTQLRAMRVLLMLVQSAARSPQVVRAGAFEVLSGALTTQTDSDVRRCAAAAVHVVLARASARLAEKFRRRAAHGGVLRAVLTVLDESTDMALVSTCAAIAQLFAARTAYHREMVELGYLPALLGIARRAVDVELMRVVMESLVRLCTYLGTCKSDEMPAAQMADLLNAGAVDVIGACIRQDDQGVSSWGIGFLHEFVARGVGKDALARSPHICRWLCRSLATAKYAYTNQLVLRSLWSLCAADGCVRADIVDHVQNLRRILGVFAIEGDAESHYWAIVIVSKVAGESATHKWILASPLVRSIEALIATLPRSFHAMLLPELANIVARICHCATSAPLLAAHPQVARACVALLRSDVEAARLAASMTIINATATAPAFLRMVAGDPTFHALIEMLCDFERERAQTYAAKALVSLVYSGEVRAEYLVEHALLPFLGGLDKMYTIAIEAHMHAHQNRDSISPRRMGYQLATLSAALGVLQIRLAELDRDSPHYLMGKGAGIESAIDLITRVQTQLVALLSVYAMILLGIEPEFLDISQVAEEAQWRSLLAFSARTKRDPKIPVASGRVPSTDLVADCAVLTYFEVPAGGKGISDVHYEDAAHALSPSYPKRMLYASDDGDPRPMRFDSLFNTQNTDARDTFQGELRYARFRLLMPAIRMLISALADALEPALMVQRHETAARVVRIARILYREMPGLRGLVMRLLANINVRVLSRHDSVCLLEMCTRYLIDTQEIGLSAGSVDGLDHCDTDVLWSIAAPIGSAAVPHETPSAVVRFASAPVGDWNEVAKSFALSDEVLAVPKIYYRKFPELEPRAVVEHGRVFAQFAVDRFVARWDSCSRLYTSSEPLGSFMSGSGLIVDRSGPRGPQITLHTSGVQLADSEIVHDVSAEQRRSSASITFSDPIVARHAISHRPLSPFPTSFESEDSAPLVSLLGAPIVRSESPFYPLFVCLGDGRTVWNSSWRFESARTSSGIDGRLGGVHRFHVRLLTSGLMQIGWCTDRCRFYPESGQGVGDDFESVSCDGFRKRKWFGVAEDNAYGEQWCAGDVITSELDFDRGRVEFYRNGVSMGVAFGVDDSGVLCGARCGFGQSGVSLPVQRIWFPAVSLASEQGVVFLGSDEGPDFKKTEMRDLNPRVYGGERVADLTPLREVGVYAAFRVSFEFQDLESFPCVTVDLPRHKGRVYLGPAIDHQDLSTYLHPTWYVLWVDDLAECCEYDIVDDAQSVARWFVTMVMSGRYTTRVLSNRLISTASVYFAALSDGTLCVSTGTFGDENVVLRGACDGIAGHVWLPRVSSAVVSFDVRPIVY